MNELNEKLAELCGLELGPEPNGEDSEFQYVYSDGDQWYERWNPTTDLSQLKMCYDALSEDEKESFAFNNRYAPTDWVFTNPELVAQAILKAKEVS